jgi:hypothetical protein
MGGSILPILDSLDCDFVGYYDRVVIQKHNIHLAE